MGISTFLHSENPSQLRGLAWLALSELGSVGTLTSTSDSGGGVTQTVTWGTASIPCRIDPIGRDGSSGLVGGRIDERSTHVVTVPAGVAIGGGNQFAITGRGTFEVTATRQQTGEYAHLFEVLQVS